MPIFELFSKRQKKLRGDVPDVYTYDNLPNSLRVQIVHILSDTLGNEKDYSNSHDYHGYSSNKVKSTYEFIVDTLCREYGLFKLPSAEKYGNRMYLIELANYLLREDDVEKQLDIVELSFKAINLLSREFKYLQRSDANNRADNAILELNNRFKEHGIGYQFVENEIIRIDSELLHVEAVKPALRL